MDRTTEYIASARRMAVVGVSDKKMGGTIYRTLKKQGWDVYPVHPARQSFDGDKCYANLKALPEGVKVAVLSVSPTAAEAVVADAAARGMTYLWFQRGADFSAAETRAASEGLRTVSGKCILMYAQPARGIHAVHRFLARLFGAL